MSLCLPLRIAGLLIIIFISGCTAATEDKMPQEKTTTTTQAVEEQSSGTQQPERKEQPVLKNLGVEIGPRDKSTNLAGDLIFDERLFIEDSNIKNEWAFVEFGATGQLKSNPLNRNVEFWFYVPSGTKVKAPMDGTVTTFPIEHTKDWGVHLQQEGSAYIVSFEHMVNLQVTQGDYVKTGDILGEAGPRIQDISMVELAVWQGGQAVMKFCPFDFLDDSLKPAYEEKLNRLAADWEEFAGRNIYNEEGWVSPGCLVQNITE